MNHLETVARSFAVAAPSCPPEPVFLQAPACGRSLVITGPSGAGKSRALRALGVRTPGSVFVEALSAIDLARPVRALFEHVRDTGEVLALLSKLGLSDATLWPRAAQSLSTGEQRRLEIALALSLGRGRARFC